MALINHNACIHHQHRKLTHGHESVRSGFLATLAVMLKMTASQPAAMGIEILFKSNRNAKERKERGRQSEQRLSAAPPSSTSTCARAKNRWSDAIDEWRTGALEGGMACEARQRKGILCAGPTDIPWRNPMSNFHRFLHQQEYLEGHLNI